MKRHLTWIFSLALTTLLAAGCGTTNAGNATNLSADYAQVPRPAPAPPVVEEAEPPAIPQPTNLDLTKFGSPVVLPARLAPDSDRDKVLIAHYVSERKPGNPDSWLSLAAELGDRYEPAFTRAVFGEAFKTAFGQGNLVAVRGLLVKHDGLPLSDRVPESRFISEIRRMSMMNPDQLGAAYDRLTASAIGAEAELIARRRAQVLSGHRTAVLRLLNATRLGNAALDDLVVDVVEHEIRLSSLIASDSSILLYAAAEREARAANASVSEAQLAPLMTRIFLERTGLVSSPPTGDLVLGHTFARR